MVKLNGKNIFLVRTCAENIDYHLPGVVGAARELTSPIDIWECFFTDEMLNDIVENTTRFDDKTTRLERQEIDKLATIRTFFETFNSNCKKYYIMSEYTTVDEKLEAFRGRCGFKIYMPQKPNRYGIKIYALTDAKMFFTAHMDVGKQPPSPYQVNTSNIGLVPRLCEHIWNSDRNVTMDNFFTAEVAEELLAKKLTILGTIKKKTNVASRISPRKSACGEAVCVHFKNILL
ncbi:Transposase IS4 [Popillia japonica]|uniref:Transposase IS4 n=1 Tax=Popillia japonica TaxID=7064 RepID=A0AAW1KGG0_POPJA